MIAAGIDIGTNTALMVVVSLSPDGSQTVLHDVHELPRLGEGLSQAGFISHEAVERALRSMEKFRSVLAPYPSVLVRAVATSAVREASNGTDVAVQLSRALGHPVEIIDGTEEARLTYIGSVGSTPIPTLLIDVGGGSTEYAVGCYGKVAYSVSIPIGAVKFTERFARDRPISESALAEACHIVESSLAPYREHFSAVQHCIGVAGTPVALAMIDKGLAAYDMTQLHGHCMSMERVSELSAFLCRQTLESLRAIPGLHERRADIVPMGSVILRASLEALGISSIEARTTGLRFGACHTAGSYPQADFSR